ncbi:MAG TPA: FGGY family carbohydrate kinase [Actinopolymorphaceae bacterium]|nr:FGGY family carbohydrate kinase [Actinopolymorphaceae bacterium]
MASVVIGVDVGTTGVKAVLLSATGQLLAEAGEEYVTHYVEPGGAEQDPDDWWRTTARSIAGVLNRGGVPAGDVAGVGVSSQAPSVVVVDAAGRPVRPALLWLDRRGRAGCEARAAHAAEILARTGNRLDAYFAAPKLAWLLAAEPGVRRAGRQVLMANGYVVRMLTGHATCDTGHAGLTLLGDLATGHWSADLAELWGVPAAWLPKVAEPSAVAGTVTPEAASATRLLAGTPVVTGVVDGAAASLEAGLASHGDVCEMTGQSTVVNAAVDVARLRHDALGTVSVLPYPIRGHHLVYGSMVATGGILRWFREEFGDRERALAGPDGDAFGALDQLAGEAPLGSGGLVLLPYFLGERSPIWDADARGALVGLSMGSRRSDVVRAILEGTAYGLAHNLDELARLGLRPAVLRSVGGGAKGRTWNQIKADVTGLPIELPYEARGAPVGAALVAAAGVGIVDDLAATVRARTQVAERIEPDTGRHAAYQPYVRIYRDLYPSLRRTYEQLAALRSAPTRDPAGGDDRPNPDH